MNFEQLTEREEFSLNRDPRSAGVGYHIGDWDGVLCQFQWFDDVAELVDYLLDVHMELCAIDQAEHDEWCAVLEPILEEVRTFGLTETTRVAFNSLDLRFTVHWWGTLQDLLSGQTQFSREMLGSFAVGQGGGSGVESADMPAFVEFLRTSCTPACDSEPAADNDAVRPPESTLGH